MKIYHMTQHHSGQLPGERHNSKETHALRAYSSTVYHSQDLEATQVSINRGTDKEVLARMYNGILLAIKKGNQIVPFAKMW